MRLSDGIGAFFFVSLSCFFFSLLHSLHYVGIEVVGVLKTY